MAEINEWWQLMFDDATIAVQEAKVDDFLLWQNIDFQNEIFAPFNDPRSNNFAKIHFWKARDVQLFRSNELENACFLRFRSASVASNIIGQ